VGAGAVRNVLLVTLDQLRGDTMGCAGHPLVRTPTLDALAADGVRLDRHYSQSSPCGPGRACLYTGTYQMNNRVVGNGSPLDRRFDNVALAARRAGFEPAMFGYTDQAVDPRETTGSDDPRLSTYEGILAGFDPVLDLSCGNLPWLDWLAGLGVDVSGGDLALLATEAERPVEQSLSTFTTDRTVEWLRRQDRPWFVHVSYLRPHPPNSAAGEWGQAYDPAAMADPITPADDRHEFHDFALQLPIVAAPSDLGEIRRMRAQYLGMVSEVDAALGRLLDEVRELGAWDDTLVIVTSDHGNMLGDHGLIEKLGYWEESYRIPGIVRDPRFPERRGTVVDRFTENVDLMPTICEAIGVPVPAQCDGMPLTPLLAGEEPPWWRTSAHWEFDWRSVIVAMVAHEWPWDRTLERQNLAVVRAEDAAYVHFGDGSSLCFDLAADPTWRTPVEDPAVVLALAQDLLTWRATHADRTLADLVLEDGGVGRWPAMPTDWA